MTDKIERVKFLVLDVERNGAILSSGTAEDKDETKALAALRQWMASTGLSEESTPILVDVYYVSGREERLSLAEWQTRETPDSVDTT